MTFDWNDIEGSVSKRLSGSGWRDQLIMELKKVYRNFKLNRYQVEEDGTVDLPKITEIKQKFGLLSIYTSGGSNEIVHDILRRADQISLTCERCGNTGRQQRVGHWIQTLCCWCYNREIERKYKNAEVRWPDMLELDVAERFPDLVSPHCATLKASVGPGWLILLGDFLDELHFDEDLRKLPPGAVQISDIKTSRDGTISVSFSRYYSCVARHLQNLEFQSTLTCAKCGHVGDVVRAKDKSDLLCAHCLIKAIRA